jgi:hypothetical protein
MAAFNVTEGGVRFEFEAEAVLKWDDHDAFIQGIRRLPGTKAVDFVVTLSTGQLALVEVKNFRGHRIENRDRITTGELAKEVAAKARDSIAGLLWASEREHDDGSVSVPALRVSRKDVPKVLVVFWLDDDRADAAVASALLREISKNLRSHVSAKVIVTSRRLERAARCPLDWLRSR